MIIKKILITYLVIFGSSSFASDSEDSRFVAICRCFGVSHPSCCGKGLHYPGCSGFSIEPKERLIDIRDRGTDQQRRNVGFFCFLCHTPLIPGEACLSRRPKH